MLAAAYNGARMVFKLSCIAPFVKLYRKSKATEQLQSRCMLAKIWDILTLKIQRCNKVFFSHLVFATSRAASKCYCLHILWRPKRISVSVNRNSSSQYPFCSHEIKYCQQVWTIVNLSHGSLWMKNEPYLYNRVLDRYKNKS